MQVKIFTQPQYLDLEGLINKFLVKPKIIIFNIFYSTSEKYHSCMIYYDFISDSIIQRAIKEQTSPDPSTKLYQ